MYRLSPRVPLPVSPEPGHNRSRTLPPTDSFSRPVCTLSTEQSLLGQSSDPGTQKWNEVDEMAFCKNYYPPYLFRDSCKKIWIKIFLRSCMPFPVGHWNRCLWLAVDQSACSRSVFSDFNVPLIVILERWFQNEVESDWYWNGTHTRKVRYSFHSSWSRQWWATARR